MMEGFTAFILGVMFGAIAATGISMTLKAKKAKPTGSVTSGGTNDPKTGGKTDERIR